MLTVKLVDKFLPRNKASKYLYEVILPEEVHRNQNWLQKICAPEYPDAIESFYEMNTPLLLRAVLHLGSTCRVSSAAGKSGTYKLSDLRRVDHPVEGEYLHKAMSYKRIFLYEQLNENSGLERYLS